MKREGFVFTLDAILALLLVTMFVASIVQVSTNPKVYSTYMRSQDQHVAEDTLIMLRTVPLKDIVPPEKLNEWINDGTINTTLVTPDMTPLDIVATYWATGPIYNESKWRHNAGVILGYLLNNTLKGYNYELLINNYTSPYLRKVGSNYTKASDVSTATFMVSGYNYNQTPRGYVAKAYLTKLVTTQEKLIGIQRVLAGGEYCSNPEPLDYDDYTLTVSSIYLEYQTVPGDKNTVQSGSFRLSGTYSGGSVNVDEDLNRWSVDSSLLSSYILLKNGVKTLKLYLNNVLSPTTTTYRVREIVYTDSSGNQAVVYLNSGVYVEVSWSWDWGWYISSSRAYTTVPNIVSAVYRIPVPPYICWGYSDNSLDVKFTIKLPENLTPLEGTLSVYARKLGNTFDLIKFNNAEWHNRKGELTIPPDEIKPTNLVELKVSRYYDYDELGLGSGSWVYLKYRTSTPKADDPGLVRLYTITSEGTGVYYLNSLFVPGNVTGINIKLTFEGVHEVRIYYSNGTGLNLIYEKTGLSPGLMTLEIDNATLLGNLTKYVTLSELSRRNFNLVIMLDAKYDSRYSRPVRYAGQDYHVEWNNQRILHGYPDSYINITYIPKVTTTRFTIPIEETHELSSDSDTEMHFSYYLPDKAQPWYVDMWTGISYTPGSIDPSHDIILKEGPSQQEFLRFPLDMYLIRVAYTKIADYIMVNGSTNRFKIESEDFYYGFRADVSRAIVHYFLNGYAGYGKTFPYYAQDNACGYNLTYWYDIGDGLKSGTILIGNCPPGRSPKPLRADELKPGEYALDDAICRLFVQLGARDDGSIPGTEDNPIKVELKGLASKAIGIKNVPDAGGAITVTLRVWREN